MIEIKLGTVDYVNEATPGAKFYANPSTGASRQIGEIYAQNFYLHIPFFQKLTYRSDPSRILVRDGSNDVVSRKGVPFGG